MDDERRVERPMMAGKDDMTTETTKARVTDTVDPFVGRSGHCMDCENWKGLAKIPRDRATYGTCVQYGRTTSHDSSCNRRFVPANVSITGGGTPYRECTGSEVDHG